MNLQTYGIFFIGKIFLRILFALPGNIWQTGLLRGWVEGGGEEGG